MWPFDRKKKEAEKMWRTLQDRPEPDAMNQLINSIVEGDTDKSERLFHQLMKEKVRQVINDANR